MDRDDSQSNCDGVLERGRIAMPMGSRAVNARS